MAPVLFQLEPPFYVGYLIVAAVPLLLLMAFHIRSKPMRIRYLRHESAKAFQAVGGTPIDPGLDITHLDDLYELAQRKQGYVVPFAVFWSIWLFGWYWSVVAIAVVLQGSHPALRGYPLTVLFDPVPAAAFLGSAHVIFMYLTARAVRGDLQPKAFTHFAARLGTGTVLGWAVAMLAGLTIVSLQARLFVAFGAGLFPASAILLIARAWRKVTGLGEEATSMLPIRSLQGVGPDEELRLWEEGVTDAQHMATEKLNRLAVNTHYPVERLIDWKDQAFLYVYVPNEFDKWRSLGFRGSMDVLGIDAKYYGQARHDALVAAIAASLGRDQAFVERIVNTTYSDPRVHELWNYLTTTHPGPVARPIDAAEVPPSPPSLRPAPPPSSMSK